MSFNPDTDQQAVRITLPNEKVVTAVYNAETLLYSAVCDLCSTTISLGTTPSGHALTQHRGMGPCQRNLLKKRKMAAKVSIIQAIIY